MSVSVTQKNGLLAALLSFLIPGAGQLYKGRWVSAIIWFVLVPTGYYFLIIPGAILHLLCIIFAAAATSR